MLKKIAVFASGNGSNFQAILEGIHNQELHAEICFVFSDQLHAGVLQRAKNENIPTFHFREKDFISKAEYEKEILKILVKFNVEWIILAGYMRLIGETLLTSYEKKIINIHPSLLPAFPGIDAVGQALHANVKVTGVTVHYVDAGMDTGPIIAQKAINITPTETIESLSAKVHRVEHLLYPSVIQKLIFEVK